MLNGSKEEVMQRMTISAMVICLVIAETASAQVDKTVGKFGFGVDGGVFLPVSGDITSDSTFSDYFNAGPGLGGHVTYAITKEAAIRAGFSYTFLKLKDEANGDPDLEPYFRTPYFYLDGVLNLGGFMKPEGIVNPYLTAGPGIYMWTMTDDGVDGDPMRIGQEEFKKTSLGLHFGPGVEIFATPALSLFAEGKYHLIFTEDEEKFGEDFANLSGVDVSAGVTYHFNITPE